MSYTCDNQRRLFILVSLICIFFWKPIGCGEGSLTPDPGGDVPYLDFVKNQADEPITSAAMGEAVVLVGENFVQRSKVFFGDKQAVVKSVTDDGIEIETTVPHLDRSRIVSLYVVADDMKSNELLFQVVGARSYPVEDVPKSVAVGDLD